MKGFTKFCLILAAIVAALGLVGIGAGMAMGAAPEDFLNIAMDETRHTLKYEESKESEISVSVPKTTEKAESAVPGGVVYGTADTQSLELELKAGTVDIYLYDGEEIVFVGENVEKYLECEAEGSKVSLEDHRKSYQAPWKLEIYLPDRTFRELELDLGAAEVYIEALHAEEISIDLGAGSLEADSIVAERSADLDVGAGLMRIAYLEGKDLELDCGVGTLEILLQGRESDYSCVLDCGAGSIQLGESMYSGLGRETRVENGGSTSEARRLDVDCGIGEISIEFEEE